MTRYLLDTNIVSDLVRNPQGRAAAAIKAVGQDRICTSIVVAAELRYGAAKKGSARLTEQLDAILDVMDVVSLESPADSFYGRIRSELEKSGQLIGPNDLLIAAQASALGLVLVTDNEREFSRVAGLTIENWLR